MSGLDYSTFSLWWASSAFARLPFLTKQAPSSSALTPSQPSPPRSYPADNTQQHVAQDVIDSGRCNVQRDDLRPSCTDVTDRPREGALPLSGSHQRQGPCSPTFPFPGSPPLSDSADNILCAQLGGFHFTQPYGGAGGHGHGVDETAKTPTTAIMENSYVPRPIYPSLSFPTYVDGGSSWSSPRVLHFPESVRGSGVSQSIEGASPIAEDARPDLFFLHDDVSSTRLPGRRMSMAVVTDGHLGLGRGYDFGLAGPSSSTPLSTIAVDAATFLSGGMITSPSPPSTAYHDDDFSGADCAHHPFSYADHHLTAMTRTAAARDPATHSYPLDRPAAQSLGGYQESVHQGICLDHHHFTSGMATPFPGYPSSQSPHDHPICDPPSFSTAIHAEEELPRPGSAPPLIDSQVPFVGDARAVLLSSSSPSSENATSGGDHVNRLHACQWYPHQGVVSPCAGGQSPRSSPRRAGSIGHSSQKTPPGSRHLRRWSSVTNPALRASPPPSHPHPPSSFPTSFPPNVVPFPRYPPPVPSSSSDTNSYAHFSPSGESESEDSSPSFATIQPHAIVDVSDSASGADPQQQPPMRAVIQCDGHLVDEESWNAAFQRADKLLHVYECFWDRTHSPCGMWIEGDQSSVADHLALFHGFRGGEVTTRCLWRECPRPHMKGTSIARHVVTHIGFRVKCNTCKHEFARVDACNRAHSRSGCGGVGQPMYGDLQRMLDARKVDPMQLQRPSKKRRTDECMGGM